MKVTFTSFSGLKIIQSKTYKDNRGFVKESYKQKNFKNKDFIFGIISSSKKMLLEVCTYKQNLSKQNICQS